MHPRSTSVIAGLSALALAACMTPLPEAYTRTGPPEGQGIGRNASNEACIQQSSASSALIYCGTWQNPSARVASAGPADAAALRGIAAAGPWRAAIDSRLACGEPVATTILNDAPAYVLSCVRKAGGWPQVAMAALVNGQAWTADGIQPAFPVIPRAIGVLAGVVPPEAAPTLQPSGADALLARRLAAHAFTAGDVGQYERLMAAGTRANQAESFAAAEQAYRAALALQVKALGRNSPDRVTSLLPLALQVSDQGRFAEADSLFAEADRLAPLAASPLAVARLPHYRALHEYNQHHADRALPLLRDAEARYAAILPPEALTPRQQTTTTLALGRSGPARVNTPIPGENTLIDTTQQNAMIGLLEARRYRALALRDLGRTAESEAAIASAAQLAIGQNMRQPALTARLLRTAAASADARGDLDEASSAYQLSGAAFGQALPGTRPEAATLFLHAAQLQRQGRTASALAECRRGATLLRELKSGIEQELIHLCLDVYAAAARGSQAVLAEMFEAAQLAQGGITSQQIAQSAARLAETARDPRVGAAIRTRQDAGELLAELERQRDLRGRSDAPAELGRIPPAELDERITQARAALADSDATLQAASPGFGQLVQEVAPAAAVQAALRPDEAFVAITLGRNAGWVFAVRKTVIAAAPLGAPPARIAELARRLRASVEPGASGPPAFDAQAAEALYAATLGTVASALQGAADLVVAPSGPLLSIPFGILLTGPAGPDLAHAPWLVRRSAVAHVPAAGNFVALRRIAATSRAARPWFGMGGFRPVTQAQARRTLSAPTCADDARLLAGLPALPYARPELAAAQALLGATAGDELLDRSFTVAQVRQAPLRDYRVLHFASHALLPAELKCVSEPAIITSAPAGAPDADGALLTSSQVANLVLDADAVILSACNTAGPQGPAGESLSGLARAFFYAGARSLLATHWSINDQASAYLVAETLKRARSQGMAASLREAQLALLDEAGTTLPAALAHPFYWGAFALVGDGTTSAGVRVAGL